MRRAALPALVALAVGWALTLWVAPWNDDRISDLFVYRPYAELMVDYGGLPYRDAPFEYPPLAVPAIAVPGLAGTGEETFGWAFALWTLGAAAVVVLLCGELARATGADPRRAMLAAALLPLLCGALVRTRFDLFPVALLLAGLALLCRDRPRSGLAVLGLGGMTKFFPLIAAPVALVWLVARGRRSEAWQAALACAVVVAVGAAAAVAVSPSGAADAVEYHLDRPVQVESTPALVLLGLDAAGAGEARSVNSHRSDGLLHPAADAITALLGAAFVGFLALLCLRAASGGAGRRELVIASLAACTGFALFGKVLSPQFMIWVVPLGALAFAWRLYPLAAAVALAAVLTKIEFPAHYLDVVEREPVAIALVAVRNLALAAVLVLSVRALQPGRHQELLDGRRPALAVRLH